MREIHIDMVLDVPDREHAESILTQFVDWVESKDFKCGGGVRDITNDPYLEEETNNERAIMFGEWRMSNQNIIARNLSDKSPKELYDHWYQKVYLTRKT